MSNKLVTAGELRRQLECMDDSAQIHLPGGLTFYRFKQWSDDEFLFEVNEPQAHLSDEFKKKNANVKVAFINVDDVIMGDEGLVSEPINTEIS